MQFLKNEIGFDNIFYIYAGMTGLGLIIAIIFRFEIVWGLYLK